MVTHNGFDYHTAFERNLGWISEREQLLLRGKRVAIVGMGGVGGNHLLTLTRLGIGAFHVADFDTFSLANFNRQAGAMMSTIGESKVEVMAKMARDINPELELELFKQGVTDETIDAFLAGVDLFIDGIDFFALEMRARLFARCAELGIPAITAAPLGMGTAYLIFMPGKMTFAQWFKLEGLSEERQYINFLVGVNPKGFQMSYLVDPTRLHLDGKRGPSTPMGVQLCAGVTGAEACKILLGRGKVYAAPYYHHFDPFVGRFARGWMPGGNGHPLQRLKLQLAYRSLAGISARVRPPEPEAPADLVESVLTTARWAPSGDNEQPWSFEQTGESALSVTATDKAAESVYDYAGRPSLLSFGMLLETMRLAASRRGRAFHYHYAPAGEHTHALAVEFPQAPEAIERDPLVDFVPLRSVDRFRYRLKPLDAAQKQALAEALGDDLEIRWFESARERWRIVRLNMMSTRIRLSIREAFNGHRRILDWQRNFSPTGVPALALGVSKPTIRLMRWLMRDWTRMNFMNRYLGGTVVPSLEMDVLPGMFASAHFVVSLKQAEQASAEDLLEAGRRIQRFWLTATRLGLVLQPSVATLAFAHHGAHDNAFSASEAARKQAETLAIDFAALGTGNTVFMGRIGLPTRAVPLSRSVRRPLADLMTRTARITLADTVPVS